MWLVCMIIYRAFHVMSQSRENGPSAIFVYSCVQSSVWYKVRWTNMVLCVVISCSKRSGRDKDVCFFRIPSKNMKWQKNGGLGFLRQYPERVSKTVAFWKMTVLALNISYRENLRTYKMKLTQIGYQCYTLAMQRRKPIWARKVLKDWRERWGEKLQKKWR